MLCTFTNIVFTKLTEIWVLFRRVTFFFTWQYMYWIYYTFLYKPTTIEKHFYIKKNCEPEIEIHVSFWYLYLCMVMVLYKSLRIISKSQWYISRIRVCEKWRLSRWLNEDCCIYPSNFFFSVMYCRKMFRTILFKCSTKSKRRIISNHRRLGISLHFLYPPII